MHYTRLDAFLQQSLDAPFRCKLPVSLDAPDTDASDTYYQHSHYGIDKYFHSVLYENMRQGLPWIFACHLHLTSDR